jgi:DNA-binding response OmpR family regulator
MPHIKTVLLVDDDDELVAALRPALESAGYRVLTADDGNAGLIAAETQAPDLVVVDMMMPRKSGFLILEKIKGRPGNATRVIMITANDGVRHRDYARQLGVDDYICKPFATEQLLDSVRRLCPPNEEGASA